MPQGANFKNLHGEPMAIERRSLPTTHYTENVNTSGTITEVWRATIPRGMVFEINPMLPFIYLPTFSETIDPGGTGVTALETTYAPARVLLGHDSHVDGKYQEVVEDSDGDAPMTVTAVADHIDGATYSITVDVQSDEDHRVSYVPWVAGKVEVRIQSPRKAGTLSRSIFESDLKQVVSWNQRKWQRLDSPCWLPPNYSIVILLDTTPVISYGNGATTTPQDLGDMHRIRIPGTAYPHRQFWRGTEKPGQRGKALDDWVDTVLAQVG